MGSTHAHLIETESRTAALVASVNHVLCTHGAPGLTLRRVAAVSGVSTSSILHHLGSREHLLRVCLGQTGDERWQDAHARLPHEGLLGVLPARAHDLAPTRAWLAWQELARSEERLHSTLDHAEARERHLLSAVVPGRVEATLALLTGLRAALCRPTSPLALDEARAVLSTCGSACGRT